jgi:hypothetical protein
MRRAGRWGGERTAHPTHARRGLLGLAQQKQVGFSFFVSFLFVNFLLFEYF